MPAAPPLTIIRSVCRYCQTSPGRQNHYRLRTTALDLHTSLERRRRKESLKTEHPSQSLQFHPETLQREETKVPPLASLRSQPLHATNPSLGYPTERKPKTSRKYRKIENSNSGSMCYHSIFTGEETESLKLSNLPKVIYPVSGKASIQPPVRLPPRPRSSR